jgi:hypothetical protein
MCRNRMMFAERRIHIYLVNNRRQIMISCLLINRKSYFFNTYLDIYREIFELRSKRRIKFVDGS